MALQEQKRPNGATQGPSMVADSLPSNPSDEIFKGRALPIVPPQAVTQRRPFSPDLVTKNPLHYGDGCGTDEVIGANRMNCSADENS